MTRTADGKFASTASPAKVPLAGVLIAKAGPQTRAARTRHRNARRIVCLAAALLRARAGLPVDHRLGV